MTYLLNEILLYLIVAAALGTLVGWLMRRCGCNRDLANLQQELDQSKSELNETTTKLNSQYSQLKSRFADLQSKYELQNSDLMLMTSRWQSTLKQAKELPKYQSWLKKIQHKYLQTCEERDNFSNLAEQYSAMHLDANQKIKRLNKHVADQEAYKYQLGEMIPKVQRLNTKVTHSENSMRGLYGMIAQVQSKWRNDRNEASHLRTIQPQIEEQKNSAQWRLAELDKKYTEQFQQQETQHQLAAESLQKRIEQLTPLEGGLPGQDTKFNRFMDKIRLVGTSKNTVLGRTYKQINEVKREAVEKERVYVDTCEEKDAIIDDLREQVRTAENRAQASSAATIQKSSTRIQELETELQAMNSNLAMLREHEHTIEAFKNKLVQKPTPRLRKSAAIKKAKSAKKPSSKPVKGLKAPAKGLKIAAAKVKDDLKQIKGIGPVMENKLNDFGVYSFEQLGRLTKDDIESLANTLESFPDRIQRDKWVSQSKRLFKKKYGESLD